jgi:hypothetical protein
VVTDYVSILVSLLYREVVDVIISNRKLDDITYTGYTLSLLVKHMPGMVLDAIELFIYIHNYHKILFNDNHNNNL